jgi:hypothetical protein
MVGPDIVSSASFATWVGRRHGSNILLDTFWNEGCVFFARTTQPQAIMHLETTSNIYGRTVNPYNRELTSGGSTGGESALLGMRGSILVSILPPFGICDANFTRVLEEISEAVFDARLHMLGFTGSSKHNLGLYEMPKYADPR